MYEKLKNYIKAGYAGLYLVSPEETRMEAEILRVARELNYSIFAWSLAVGFVNPEDGSVRAAADPLDAVELVAEFPENTLVLFRDLHLFLEDPNPVLIRAIKDQVTACRAAGKAMVFLGCRSVLPPELEREIAILECDLPGREELDQVLEGIVRSAEIEVPEGEQREHLVESAAGLTCLEAENAFALSIVKGGSLDPEIVSGEKAQAMRKNGLLEVLEVSEQLDDIGGLDLLKDWLLKRKDTFSARASDYGLPTPKGLLILGVPGTGKSLTAKVTAKVLGRPLLKLDAGSLFGSLVGQSESNLRSVIQTSEAIAPCVLFIDELEKAFAGSKSSGQTDGGTSSRVFGTFLNWLQEKTAPVFVVATANDVTQLPAELLRKGRFDELMFVDLPNTKERQAIWEIQVSKYGRGPDAYDLNALVRACDGFTGAEIEQVFIEGLYEAFARETEPSTVSLARIIGETIPLSRLMSDQIRGLRDWAQGRARPASSTDTTRGERKIVA